MGNHGRPRAGMGNELVTEKNLCYAIVQKKAWQKLYEKKLDIVISEKR